MEPARTCRSGTWDVVVQHDLVVRHEHELAVLRRRDDAVVLLADGRAGRAELRLGGRRHGRAGRLHPRASPPAPGREIGNFYVDTHPLAALHPGAAVGRRRRSFLVSQGVIQTLGGPDAADAHRRRADARARPGGVAGSRSSSSARTAAASSTSTRRCRSRTRRGSRTSSRCSRSSLIPAGADRDLRAHGRQPPPGLGDLRRDARRCSSSRVAVVVRRRVARHARDARRRASTASTWRARSSASASPRRRCGPSVTTAASCGAVNGADGVAERRSAAPSRWRRCRSGEVIFGGVGSGLYGMLLFVILGVFISGLMVGRTPEFLGKKIEAREVKLTVIGDDRRADARARHDRAGDDQVGPGVDLRLRAAGLLRDALRLHLAGQQQRLGVRRLHRLPAAERHERRRVRHLVQPTCSAA